MNYLERREKIINYLKAYESISNQEAQGLTGAHRNTVTADFRNLLEENVIQRFGSGKGSRYVLAESVLFAEEFVSRIWNKKNQQALEKYFSREKRKKVFFDKTVDTSSLKEILKEAIVAEKDAIVFYLGMKDAVPENLGREKMDAIIKEEMGHIRTLSKELVALK